MKKDGGLKRCTRRSFDEAGSNVLVNRQDHNVSLKGSRVVLVFNQLGGSKYYLEVREEVAHLSFLCG